MEPFPAEADVRSPTVEEDPALGLSHREKMEILFAVMLGLFLGALDQTIVGPALPTIATELNGNDLYVWAITIYLLTSTISVPFWGKLSDLYGRKPIFMIGIVIFLVGSALSGLSQSMGMLILFRGIQGIGAGALFPVALAIIGDMFTPQERGKYQGLFGAVFGIAFIVGPLVGGFLTEQVSWHWIFYVNIPIGIVSLIVIQRLLPTVKTPRATKNFDILGGAIFTVAITFLLIGLTNKQFGDWTEPTVGGFILAGIVGILAVHPGRGAGQGTDHPARPVPQPDLRELDGLDLLRQLRVLRRDHLPAPLVPVRPWLLADELGPRRPAADGRADLQLDRVRPDRGADGPLQVAARRRHRAHGRGHRADDAADRARRRWPSSGSGCSSPGSASVRPSRSSRSSSRTPCRSASSASPPRT